MSEESTILSVGIDIGTSTTQVIFSRLTFKNSAGYFAVPHIAISDKEVVYQSDIYRTPLKKRIMIDGEQIRSIVSEEFRRAGYRPEDTRTGAVIITGESARKENSEIVLRELSEFAGEFVVSTAGPDLEAIIAGKGSGARQYSIDHQCTVANLDIGGGTTNAVVFDAGEVIAKGCLDIGGRLVQLDSSGRIDYISDSVQRIMEADGITMHVGDEADYGTLYRIGERMSELLGQWVKGEANRLLDAIRTPGSSEFTLTKPIQVLCFSGGVADCIYNVQDGGWNRYRDMGVVLGQAIRSGAIFSDFRVMDAKETIRATVVGAGSYTTSVSGSTITYNRDVFPLKNIPVLKLSGTEQETCFSGSGELLSEKIKWMQNQGDTMEMILAMKGKPNPSYTEVKRLAEVLVTVLDSCLPEKQPMIIVLECDMAKALGQMMLQIPTKSMRDVICIDSIQVDHNDFVDMGKPLVDGLVIPVVVKTLIFG